MSKENEFSNLTPKGKVLRKVAERYPEVDPEAIELLMSIKRVAKEADCTHQAALEPYGLSEGRFYVLAYLFTEDILEHQGVSPSDIADHLGVTRATITGLLDGLERDGFLERRHDCIDRRALTIHLAAKGRTFLEDFIPRHSLAIKAQMSALTAEERQTLMTLLAKIQP